MDLASLITNKPLLASLTREYELLKATNADINYEEWIVKRLKLAATQQGSTLQGAADADSAEITAPLPTSQRTTTAPSQQQQQQPNPKFAVGDGLSGRLQALARRNRISQRTLGALLYDRDGAVAFAGEQAADQPPVVAPVLQEWQAQNTTNVQHKAARSQVDNSSWAPASLWRQPETSVDTVKKIPPCKNPPNWVAAAKLQGSLQSSSAVVPLLHAAAERDRRLAATAALVRQQLAVSSSATSVDTSTIAQQRALLAQQYGADLDAHKEQQQQQHLLQQVVQQNQQLLQAVQQQQALLQRHEGLLPSTGQQTAAAAATATTAPGGIATATAAPTSSAQKVPEAVQNSWLVKSVLQPTARVSNGGTVDTGQSAAPEFIRITGEAGRQKKTQQQQQQQQQLLEQQAPEDRRSQLKAALRQLLTTKHVSRLPQQRSITGLLQILLQQQQQGGTDSSGQQQQQLLVGLRHVQAVASKQQQRRRSSSLRQSQDENALPACEDLHTEQAVQQQQQPPCRSSRVSSAAGARPDKRQQQQQQQPSGRERPGWSSEVFVPPPSHMLRRKMSGVADAWGLPAPQKPKVRPTSAASTGRPARPRSTTGASGKGSSSRRATAPGGPAKQQQNSTARSQSGSLSGALQHAAWGSTEFDVADPGAEGEEGPVADFWPDLPPAPAVAAPAAGLAAMTASQIETVELQVKQQLQQEEESRLSRLEETATHILGVLGRLEQQLQNPSAAPVAVTANSQQPSTASNAAGNLAAAAAAGAAGVLHDPLTISSMLSALDKIEAQEAEIRKRWFGSSEISPAPPVAGKGAILEVNGGVLTVHTNNASAATGAASSAAGLQQAVGSNSAQQQLQQCKSAPPAQQQQRETLSKQALKSIKAGRSRFLKHQALVDGSLEVLDSPVGVAALSPGVAGSKERTRAKQQLQPTAVVEAVADLLLDELMLQQVEELDSFCDALCNQLFEAEFEEA